MVSRKKRELCPVCGTDAWVTRKWTVNRFGRRYDYLLYRHDNSTHYSPLNQNRHLLRKGELKNALMAVINSENPSLGSFKVKDVRALLQREFPGVAYSSVRAALNRLADMGMLRVSREGNDLRYSTTVSERSLSFLIESVSISIEDVNNDFLFAKHVFRYLVRNNQAWPLYYIPFRIVGDSERPFEGLELKAYCPGDAARYKVVLLEDKPTDKSTLLKPPTPFLPGKLNEVMVEYLWPEPEQNYTFSAATGINSFHFLLKSSSPLEVTASVTSSLRTDLKDLSGSIAETSTPEWNYVHSFSLTGMDPLSAIQVRWRKRTDRPSGKES